MKRTLLFLLCALMSTQMFSETLFGYLFPTLAYLERTTCYYTEGDEQYRTINRLNFEDNMFEIDGNDYIEYNDFWLREDKEGRILVYSEPAKKDLVLYDFTLEVGDTLTTLNIDMVSMTVGDPILPGLKSVVVDYPIYINGELSCPIDTLIVTDVSMVMMRDSNEYKKWTFSNGMEYMEYIGNLGADFFPIIKNPWEPIPTCCIEERLVCASIYDRLIYQMDDAEMQRLNAECQCSSWASKWCDTWNVLEFNGMDFEQTAQTWQYKLAYDTIIDGKEYQAVTRHWTADEEKTKEYVAAVRFEENSKAFIYYDNAEYLLYDFNFDLIEGDTIEVFAGINNYEHFNTYKCVIKSVELTAGGITESTYSMDIIDPFTGKVFPSRMVWKEFVGSYNGILHGDLLVPGNSNYHLLCAYKNSSIVYSTEDEVFTDYGCEYNAVGQNPADLFPTLWGLQRTSCSEYVDCQENETYLMQADEIKEINGKQYLKYGGVFLREEDSKVLIYSFPYEKDFVLYDWTLEVGDTLQILGIDPFSFPELEYTAVVDYVAFEEYDANGNRTIVKKPLGNKRVKDISTMRLLDGNEYKAWLFGYDWERGNYYVEGIGNASKYGGDYVDLVYPFEVPSCYYGERLVCVSRDGVLLYQIDDAEMERLGTECLCQAEQNPEDLFPTLWGLQRTVCNEYCGETEDDNSNNITYKQTFTSISFENNKPYILCRGYLLREESNKILLYSESLNKEIVLYDFTLEVGDSLPAYIKDFDGTMYSDDTLVVTDISSVTLLDGKEYKKWTFNNGMEYVEGFGMYGGYRNGNFVGLIQELVVPCHTGTHLVCVSKNGKLLYQMDDAEMERLGAECLCEYDRGPRKDNAKDGQIGGRPTPTQWNQLELDLREMDNGTTILRAETFSYTLENDSVVANDKIFYQLARQSTKDTATTKSFVGALHFGKDEDNRVYFLRDGVEYVLYDFTAEPGDTIEIFAGINNYPHDSVYTHVVIGKDTLENGACRMLLEVVFPEETNATATHAEKIWLAGLGSIDGIVHNATSRATKARSSDTQTSVMLCAWREDNCLYTTDHPDYDTYGCVYNQDPTAVESPTSPSSYQKIIHEGTLLILHEGKVYNVIGIQIK